MNNKTGNQIDAVEMCLFEVQGQFNENCGNLLEAVRALSESVDKLREITGA